MEDKDILFPELQGLKRPLLADEIRWLQNQICLATQIPESLILKASTCKEWSKVVAELYQTQFKMVLHQGLRTL